MAASATVGILRVLLSADTAEFQQGVAKAATAAQTFTKDIKAAGVQSEAVAAAMKTAFTRAEEGTRGLSKAVASLVGFDTIEKANTYTKAVEAIGGVSKLTAAEQAKLNGLLTEATAKYAALGQTAPAALTALAAATKPVKDETSQLTGFMTDLGSQVKASALGFISAQAILGTVQGAFQGLAKFVGDSVHAYADQEAAVKKLTTALTAQGQATPDVIAGYEQMAGQFQQTTVHADELINEMQALLIQVGDVMPKDMEKALAAATDLSAGLGIDLQTATMLVAKAFEGQTGTLKKYGIVVDETKLKTEGVTAVLDAINEKFGGQAQAQVETYSGKVQQLANMWGEVQEAVGKAIVTDPLIVAALKHVTDEVTATADAAGNAAVTWSDYWSEIIGGQSALAAEIALSTVIKLAQDADSSLAKIAAQAKARAPLDLFKGGFGPLPADTVQFLDDYAKGMAAAAEADKKAADAAEAHRKAIAGIRTELFGQGAITAARNYAEAIGTITNLTKLSTEQQEDVHTVVTKAIEAYHRLGQSAPQDIGRLYAATLNLTKLLVPLPSNLAGIGQAIESSVVPPVITLGKVIDGLPPGFETVGRIAVPSFKSVEVHARAAGEAVGEIGRAVSELGRMMPGVVGTVVEGFGQILSATSDLQRSMAQTGQASVSMATQVANSVLFVVSAYQQLKRAGDLLTGDLGAGEFFAAVNARGGRQGLQAAGVTAGFNTNILLTTKSAATFRDQLARFDRAVADSDARLQRYGLTWKDLGDTIQQANIDQMTRDLVTDWRALRDAGLDVNTRIDKMSGGLSQLVIDAVETGQKIPVALQPMLKTLIESGKLSEDAARALLGMSGTAVVAFKDVEAAASRYGIKVEQLGKAVNQLRINDLAKQIIADWTLLQTAGADTNTVLVGMQKSVQDLVTEALRAGFKIPEGMKPIIQAMIDAGLLTDQFGNKLTGIGDIEFEKPITEAIDDLIKALDRLIDKLSGVGNEAIRTRGELEKIGDAMPRGSTGTDTGGTGTGGTEASPAPAGTPATGSNVPRRRFATGGIVGRILDFPPPQGADRIPILAAPGEGIVNVPAMHILGPDGFARLNQGWLAGPPSAAVPGAPAPGAVSVVVTVAINNPTIQDETQLAAIRRSLEDAVVDVLHRENATNARGLKTVVRRMVS